MRYFFEPSRAESIGLTKMIKAGINIPDLRLDMSDGSIVVGPDCPFTEGQIRTILSECYDLAQRDMNIGTESIRPILERAKVRTELINELFPVHHNAQVKR